MLEFEVKYGQFKNSGKFRNKCFFFLAHRTKDLTRKQEKVGPFECDVLEKQSRVSARCYPLTVHILHNDKRKRTQKTPFCPNGTRPSVMLSGRMLCLFLPFFFLCLLFEADECMRQQNFIKISKKNSNFHAFFMKF